MRAGLADALTAANGQSHDYPSGSIVLCAQCLKPLYRLVRTITVGDKAHRTVTAYRPVSVDDLSALAQRAGSSVLNGTRAAWKQYIQQIPELRTGSEARCPFCGEAFVRFRAIEESEVIDKAYTWELVTLPPHRPVADPIARAWERG